jgi:hypothetical protein
MNKVIVCNGEYRSGSTFVYNAVLKLAEQAKIEVALVAGGNQQDISSEIASNRDGLRVFKTHIYRPCLEARKALVIRSRRNPYAIFNSLARMHGYDVNNLSDSNYKKLIVEIVRQKEITRAWKNHVSLDIDYEAIYLTPRDVVARIASFCYFKVTNNGIERVTDELSIEAVKAHTDKLKKVNSRDQWRPNHISKEMGRSDAWMSNIPEEILQRIEDALE